MHVYVYSFGRGWHCKDNNHSDLCMCTASKAYTNLWRIHINLYVTMCTHTALEGDDTIRCGALHVHNLICLFPFKKNHRYRKVKLGCSILKKWKRGVLWLIIVIIEYTSDDDQCHFIYTNYKFSLTLYLNLKKMKVHLGSIQKIWFCTNLNKSCIDILSHI